MNISYKDAAVRDIAETKDYIEKNLKNKLAALKLVATILKAVSLLADNPLMGTALNSKFDVDSAIRFLVVAKQLVFYEIEDDENITVLRVIDGRRDYMSILFS